MRTTVTAVLAFLPLVGCLEIEEEIRIHAGGAVDLRVYARGGLDDLLDGDPVPLHGDWSPDDAATGRWVAAREALPAGAPARDLELALRPRGRRGDPFELRVAASFASAAAIPELWAPAARQHREAGLRRSTSLRVERRGAARVYTFARTFQRRDAWVREHFERAYARLDEGLRTVLEARGMPTEEQWQQLGVVFARVYREAVEHVVRDALLEIYTDGDARLSLAARQQIIERCSEAGASIGSPAALIEAGRELHRRIHAPRRPDAPVTPSQLELLAQRGRAAVRRAAADALADAGLPVPAQHTVRDALERTRAAEEQTDDLGDENFTVVLHLPGTVVGGNFHRARDDGAVVWRFAGKQLQSGDQVLRAVSVVE